MIATLNGDQGAAYAFVHPDLIAEGETVLVHVGDYKAAGSPVMMTWQAVETIIVVDGAITAPQMLVINYRSATAKSTKPFSGWTKNRRNIGLGI
jgi:hypothetical protein